MLMLIDVMWSANYDDYLLLNIVVAVVISVVIWPNYQFTLLLATTYLHSIIQITLWLVQNHRKFFYHNRLIQIIIFFHQFFTNLKKRFKAKHCKSSISLVIRLHPGTFLVTIWQISLWLLAELVVQWSGWILVMVPSEVGNPWHGQLSLFETDQNVLEHWPTQNDI